MIVEVSKCLHRAPRSSVLGRNAEALLTDSAIESSEELLEDDVTHDLELTRAHLNTGHAVISPLGILHVCALDCSHVPANVEAEIRERLSAIVEPSVVLLVILN